MLATLLVLGGVLLGLFLLLALIVNLSARPETSGREGSTTGRSSSWVVDAGRPHPDVWSAVPSSSTSEIPAIR